MKLKKALKLAIDIVKDERRKKYAFSANLYKVGVVSISTINAMEHYNQLTEVITELEKLQHED